MRLLQLHDNNELILTGNLIHDIPPYAILSHTWGHDGDEVTFQDLIGRRGKQKTGYQKILFCGQQAQRDGLDYFWVDTCCIDKTSSAELTEAINSMYKWYQDAQRCYVYLADVFKEDSGADADELGRSRWKAAFRESRWFLRGWTLQELVAPLDVEFFSSNSRRLGDKKSLDQIIHEITRIPLRVLQGGPLADISIEERMSWSHRRKTTRPEDSAYCLLGILNVSMPVIYGEGEDKALERLRREASIPYPGKLPVDSNTACVVLDTAHYYIPFPKNRRFTGRDKILEDIKKRVFRQECRQRLSIVGLGGMGKTQIALQLAYWVKEHLTSYSVLWIPAISLESFEQTVTEIAKRLGVKKELDDEDAKISLLRHLEFNGNHKWLLIVDNADDMDILYGSAGSDEQGIYQYLPSSENCFVLFTTRSQDIALSVAEAESDVVVLAEMSSEEATNLFAKAVFRKEILKDNQAIADLLAELTFLPLAITQAAAYLNRNRITVRKYLEILHGTENEMVRLLSAEFQDNTRYRGTHNAVATTWLVSFSQIRHTDPFAADLLLFISLIEPRGIPRSLLPEAQTAVDTEQAIGTLCGYAFLANRGNEVYDMHRLVHVAVRVWSQKHEPTQVIKDAINHVNTVLCYDEAPHQKHWRAYIPHAVRLLELSSMYGLDERYDLAFEVGKYLYQDRRFKEAISLLEQAYKWTTAQADRGDKSWLVLEHWLAVTYLNDRQISKAIELLEHVVGVRTRTLPEEDHSRLASEHELARAYLNDRQISKAIELLEHVVGVKARTLAEEDHSRLASEHELATAYLENRQISKAIEILKHVVGVRTRKLPEEDHSRLASEHELATAYLENRQISKAIEILEHVVGVRTWTLPEEDHSRLASEHELAAAYLNNRQVSKAIEILEHVVEVEARTLAEEDHSRLASEHELATAYLENRQISKAIEILKHVVGVRTRKLPEEDHSRLASEHELATAYLENRQISKAIEILEHVVGVRTWTLPEEDHSRLASEHELAAAYLNNRQVSKAIEILEHVVEVEARTLAEEDHSRLASEHELATAYLENRQISKAIEILGHVVGVRTRTLAEEDHSRLASEHALATAYLENRQVSKAIEILEHVVEVGTRTLAEEDHSRLTSEQALATAYLNDRHISKAIGILEHVVEVKAWKLAKDDPDRLSSEELLNTANLILDYEPRSPVEILDS